MTTERFVQTLDRAAVEVRRSFVGCRQRDFWEWRLRPSETRQSADLDQLLLQACSDQSMIGMGVPLEGSCNRWVTRQYRMGDADYS
jgi:hypothetical protein